MKSRPVKAETTRSALRRSCSQRTFDHCRRTKHKVEIVGQTSFLTTDPFFLRESGKHVVQRAHKRDRRHTSIVTVAVLPLDQTATAILDRDITTTTQRGHGPGGQHQNKTDSAVRMIHEPTGIMVFINGRDQHKNRRTARRILEGRVAALEQAKQESSRASTKRDQIGYGGRSGKRRTYNFIRGRVTDHITGAKTSQIQSVMKGRFDTLQ